MNSLLVAVMSKLLLYCSKCNLLESIEFQNMDGLLTKKYADRAIRLNQQKKKLHLK
jgi:hypothetical protein